MANSVTGGRERERTDRRLKEQTRLRYTVRARVVYTYIY